MLPQVYNALKDLKQSKLVKCERVHSPKELTKNMYSITPLGYAELKHWLEEKDAIDPMREAFMSKIWYARLHDKDIILNLLESFSTHRKQEIKYYLKQRTIYKEDSPSHQISKVPSDIFYARMVLDYMIARGRLDVNWAKRAIKDISNLNLNASEISKKKDNK